MVTSFALRPPLPYRLEEGVFFAFQGAKMFKGCRGQGPHKGNAWTSPSPRGRQAIPRPTPPNPLPFSD